jgi:uncharacterized circularly permuted ATP-grasp superfamily protein
MVAAPDVLRPHCEGFVRSLEALGRHEFTSRWEGTRRSIRENGVTYNIYGDPQGMDRPWELDMVPLLISPADWTRLETALLQRTRLLNLILADVYGPQTLIAAGLLPPSLVLSNPAFLRPCHGIRVPHGIHLHLHAVDLARSPDGQWWALADRTQAPSGAGYALENRIVLLRSLPETFRDCQIHKLASFFRAQRDTLMALAPQPHDQPRVVLLTPGPYNETYFEHAYLARYLGFTLVEGGDLTVRARRVFIKTLEGLQPVDVIFRRLDDSFCDPLELRGDSSLGVAGLVEAARSGNVTIANALGSGVIETAAIMPFLPKLCRHLLDEELMLPSVATWWGGHPEQLQHMLEHLDELVVKRAFPTEAREPAFGKKLGERERSLLAAELGERPDHFVAQEQVALSAAPVWHRNRMEPQSVRGSSRRFLRGDARRTDQVLERARLAHRVDAARRRQQGHLGAVGWTRQRGNAADAGWVGDAAGTSGERPAEPRRGVSVLAGTLRRTGRARNSAPAQRRRAPDRSGDHRST